MFEKYMHLERLGTDQVEGILQGEVYVFPKLDGTNASLWCEDNQLKGGSRNRVLSTDYDNAGFYNWALTDRAVTIFFDLHRGRYRLYGEWLVPHTLNTYRDDAWRKFYVFDVRDEETGKLLHYNEWKPLADQAGLDYLPPMAIFKKSCSVEDVLRFVEKNVFLIKEGQGYGEGIVVKNYDFTNKYGHVVWAKVIANAFKVEHYKAMGSPEIGGLLLEEKIVSERVTSHLVDKALAKIANEHGGWSSKYIPMLLNLVWYDLITEELWDVLKKHKNPTISFATLQRLTIAKIKELRKDVF